MALLQDNDTSSGVTLDDKPSIQLLNYFDLPHGRKVIRVTEQVSAQWEQLGDALQAESYVIDNIKRDHKSDGVTNCCRELLNKWLDGNFGDGKPTWEKFLTSLERIGCSQLARHIRNRLTSQGEVGDDDDDGDGDVAGPSKAKMSKVSPSSESKDELGEQRNTKQKPMVVTPSLIHQVVTARDLKELAKKEYDKRKERSQKNQRKKQKEKQERCSPPQHHQTDGSLPSSSLTSQPSFSASSLESQGLISIKQYISDREGTSQPASPEHSFQGSEGETSQIVIASSEPMDIPTLMPEKNKREQVLPRKQPTQLHSASLRNQTDTTVMCYRIVQQDVNEIIKKGDTGFITTMTESENIISAQPQRLVKLRNGTWGVMKILCPTSKLTVDEAVHTRRNKISYLEQAQDKGTVYQMQCSSDAQTYQLKSSSNGEKMMSYQVKHKSAEYNQAQLMIYAGKDKANHEISFCDFVFFLKTSKQLFVERIDVDVNWREKIIPRVREFCEFYNKLLREQ